MAGPTENLPKAWALIRSSSGSKPGIKTDEPQKASKYLGCEHKVESVAKNGVKVQKMTYDMSDFFKSCVEAYLKLAGGDALPLRAATTPFLEDSDTVRRKGGSCSISPPAFS